MAGLVVAQVPAEATTFPSFTAVRSGGPLHIAFDASASTTDQTQIVRDDWTFGDGMTATVQGTPVTSTITHDYAQTGHYVVRLDATDNASGTGTTTRGIDVIPVASYSAAPTDGESPLTVNFNGSASLPAGTIQEWRWTFGDGASSTSTGPNTSHTYTTGRWTSTLVVFDQHGMTSDPVSLTIVVNAPQPPVAGFSLNVPAGPAPFQATFDGSESTASSGFDVVRWEWDFGDGTSVNTTVPTTSHDYSVGEFFPSLVVVDARGLRSNPAIGHVIGGVEGFGAPILIPGQAYGSGYGGVEGGHDAVAAAAPSHLWYFAEGHTGDGFQEFLTLQNPSDSVADVLVNYYFGPGDGDPRTQLLSLPPSSRTTVAVNDIVGNGRDVSIQVASSPSSPAIVAERPMYFRANAGLGGAAMAVGGHDVVGANSPSREWYFAEGYTGPGFVTYLTLQNPQASPATATLEFLLEDGHTAVTSVALDARQRRTVNAADTVGAGHSVSTTVRSDRPIVAERPMYFAFAPETGIGAVDGGHDVMGARAPDTDFTFAEGYTGPGFTEYLTLAVTQPTNATFTYAFSDGRPAQVETSLLPTGRQTVLVNDKVSPGDVSVRIQTDNPVVAERPMYFRADPGLGSVIDDGHVVLGSRITTGNQYLAEGYTGAGFVEYLTLASFSDSAQSVRVTVLYDDGTAPDSVDVAFSPRSRRTLRVGRDVGRADKSVSVIVSNPAGAPVIAERPMYFRFNPFPPTDPSFHDFIFGRPNGVPARWNPCAPIHYRVNPNGGPANAIALAQQAVGEASGATGMTFVYDGTSAVIPTSTYFNRQPQTDLLIAYATQSQTDILTGAAGVGSPIAFLNADGVYVIVAAFVVVDQDSRLQTRFGYGYSWGNLLLHEVGHAVGLAHPLQASEVMHPPLTGGAPNGYNQGDLQGLRELGATQGCLKSPLQ